ncbi:uncharacterized protein LOC100828337 isoform X2 [Brachypodium distachyon]|uniref:Uncharacterized protein n=1 Tax=Brachypodium distachyon TaxID=15368 RepID=I1IQE8_BRADI|nr:uncharacterized protein LOC100828337 isoform X2 [Brachypodium distachyon]KQJ90383.1 hypothetical protein BRADI_4g31180v3 [Brachypodium distachyon]|eukprot:XP_010238206.1 uncharacterized protein LOC100828337 isoform X2 [Brachypodium distachyon]
MEDFSPRFPAAGERDPRFGKVQKRKREHDCTTASSESGKPTDCTTGSIRNGDLVDNLEKQFGYFSTSGQGVWGELSKQVASKLSERVYAIAAFKGIIIHWKPRLITLLTSASLVRSFHDESKISEDLTIRVWNEYYQYADAWLEQYDLHHNIALVNFQAPGCASPASLQHKEQLESGSKVVAVGCLFNSRKLMATSGIVMDKLSRSDGEEFIVSTCKVSKAGTGGPLVDFNGFFHGMNFYDVEQTIFLPRNIILKCIERFGIFRAENKQGGHCAGGIITRSTNNGVNGSPDSCLYPQACVDRIHENLRSRSYPLPTKFCGGMVLVNGFEEKFPNMDGTCGDGLNQLSKEVASNLSRSVVSLASFSGKRRLFACTGIVIEYNLCTSVLTSASLVRSSEDENRIDDNLRIEVRLPNKQYVIGKLQHCSLHYNIALVNIVASPYLHAASLNHQVQFESGSEVVAVGRIFAVGKLTAISGTLTDKRSKFDCTELRTSTCKIRKGGIGGPLVDLDGHFIGMNFYDEEETPFIPRNLILECLRRFETERSIAADMCNLNRWPVPKPYWVYPAASDWDMDMNVKVDMRAATLTLL